MAFQKYDIRKPESDGGHFEERYWGPINTPVSAPDKTFAWIIHRVDDVTDFVRLKRKGLEQEKVNEQLRARAGQMETEIYLRASQAQQTSQLVDAR
jgi:hypothetical protein